MCAKKFKATIFALIALSLFFLLTGVGCAPKAEEKAEVTTEEATEAATEEAVSKEEEITLTIWSYFAQPNYENFYKWVDEEFRKKHPNATVEVTYISQSDYSAKIKAAMAAGNPPDLFNGWAGSFHTELWESGNLIDLTPYYKQDPEWQKNTDLWKLLPPLQDSIENSLILATTTMAPFFVFYYQDILDAHNLEVPETVDDLIAMKPVLNKDGIDVMSMGFKEGFVFYYLFNQLEAAYDPGQGLLQKMDAGEASWDNDVIRKTLQDFKRIYDSGIFPRGSLQLTYDPDSKEIFKTRKAAFFWPSGIWMDAYLDQQQIESGNIKVMLFPKTHKQDPWVFIGSYDLSHLALAKTKHQDLVIELLKFMNSPAAQEYLWNTAQIMPVSSAVITKPSPSRILDEQAKVTVQTQASQVYDWNIYSPLTVAAISNGMATLALGEKTVDEVIADIVVASEKDHPK